MDREQQRAVDLDPDERQRHGQCIQPNTDAARSGTATVAGRQITVNQDSGCTVSLSPATQPMLVGGGPGSVTVTAGVGCPWTAVSSVGWMTITSGASGSGGGTVRFTVDANTSDAARTGTITIADQVFTLTQAGS